MKCNRPTAIVQQGFYRPASGLNSFSRAYGMRTGGRLVHALDAATTHVLHSPGEAAWPGLVHAAVRGGPALVSQDWWVLHVRHTGVLAFALCAPGKGSARVYGQSFYPAVDRHAQHHPFPSLQFD